MTGADEQLVIGAVADEATRPAAVAALVAAELLTPDYAAWYADQTPLRQSAEWSRGGFIFLQVQRVKVSAAANAGTVFGKIGGLLGAAAGGAGGLLAALFRPLAWLIGGVVVVLIILALVLRR